MVFNSSQTLRTAEKHLSRGRLPAAIEEYRKLVNWDPSDLTMLNTLGDLYIRVGFTEQARLIFARVAQAYRHQGFTSKAIAIFKKLLRIDPTDIDSGVSLAQCYVTQGLRKEAGRQYADVAEAYRRAGQEDKALDIYQRMSEIDPSNISMLMMLGERWLREGLRQRANASFAAAGEELCRQRNDQQALLAYLKAHAAQPDDVKTLSAIASVCAALGQSDSAIPILRESLARNPGEPELLRILGSAYLSSGQLDEAEKSFQRLLALDSSACRNLLAVGEKYMESGDLDRAVQLIVGCVDSFTANRSEREAVDFLNKALACDPQHIASLKNLARIFRLLREDFNLTPILSALANGALQRGDRDEAIEALTELCSIEPHEQAHWDALERLGVQAHSTALFEFSATGNAGIYAASDQAIQSIFHTAADLCCDGDSASAEALPETNGTSIVCKNLDLHFGLEQFCASESLVGTVNDEQWPLIENHEFIAADDVRTVPPLPLNNSPTPAATDVAVTGFELLASDNRRRAARVTARVPVVVISDSGGWREFTETVDVSDSGLMLQLAHPISPSTSLRVSIEMTKWPERVARIGALKTTKGIVRHCFNRPGNSNLVGIELHQI